MKKIVAFLLRHEYLVWALCLCALLRLPSLLEPYWYGDEGIYLTLGNGVRHGLQLYRDIHDNKPPIIYLMAALSGTVFWFRFFLLVWNSVAIVAFERLAHRLLDRNKVAGTTKFIGLSFPKVQYSTIATFLFAILPFFAEGSIANGEIFMIMPVIVGVYLLWRNSKNSLSVILAGFSFSLAFLIKVPALFDAFSVGFFFFLLFEGKSVFASLKSRLPYLFAFAFLAPILISFLYYASIGAGKQYVAAAFAQNVGYLSSWATGTHASTNVGSSGLKNRAIVLAVTTVILVLLKNKNGKRLTFLLLWFAFALFGALLSERPYPHYLIQIIPPVSLLLVFFYRTFKDRKIFRLMPIFVGFIVLFVSLWTIKFWYYPQIPYYVNYIQFVTKAKSMDDYFSYFDPRLPTMYRLASYLEAHTTPDEPIFVWGDVPMLYALTKRLPPGKYTSSYHIKDFNGFDETTQALETKKPKYVIIDTSYEAPYEGLHTFLEHDYIPTYSFTPFAVYRRTATPTQ
ncbi:MAG: hypothetical protein ABI758_03770 [Candidatus Woesebacteria bacterium]